LYAKIRIPIAVDNKQQQQPSQQQPSQQNQQQEQRQQRLPQQQSQQQQQQQQQYRTLNVFTCHFDAHDEHVRRAQLYELKYYMLKWVPHASKEPIIIAGDWNIDSLSILQNKHHQMLAGNKQAQLDYERQMAEQDDNEDTAKPIADMYNLMMHRVFSGFHDVFASDRHLHPVTYPCEEECIDHVLYNSHVKIVPTSTTSLVQHHSKQQSQQSQQHAEQAQHVAASSGNKQLYKLERFVGKGAQGAARPVSDHYGVSVFLTV